jgi:DNA-directed RNA polymerase
MTTVYGVTFVGAREQIERQLRIAEIVDPDMRYQTAAYLANVVSLRPGSTTERLLRSCLDTSLHWQSLPRRQGYPKLAINLRQAHLPVYSRKPHFPACRRGDGQENTRWWGRFDITKANAKEHMTAVIWTTLLGLPVVQPYRKQQKKQLVTRIQTVFISDPNKPGEGKRI